MSVTISDIKKYYRKSIRVTLGMLRNKIFSDFLIKYGKLQDLIVLEKYAEDTRPWNHFIPF